MNLYTFGDSVYRGVRLRRDTFYDAPFREELGDDDATPFAIDKWHADGLEQVLNRLHVPYDSIIEDFRRLEAQTEDHQTIDVRYWREDLASMLVQVMLRNPENPMQSFEVMGFIIDPDSLRNEDPQAEERSVDPLGSKKMVFLIPSIASPLQPPHSAIVRNYDTPPAPGGGFMFGFRLAPTRFIQNTSATAVLNDLLDFPKVNENVWLVHDMFATEDYEFHDGLQYARVYEIPYHAIHSVRRYTDPFGNVIEQDTRRRYGRGYAQSLSGYADSQRPDSDDELI